MMFKTVFLFSLYILFSIYAAAQENGCNIEILIKNEKPFYQINDTIIALVKVETEKTLCEDAGEKTKIFCDGLKIIERSEWKKISPTVLGQKLIITVSNENRKRLITAYRKNSHQDCFEQKEIKVLTNQ